MNETNKYKIAAMVLAAAVIVLIIVLIAQNSGRAPAPQTNGQQPATTTTETASSSGSGSPSAGTSAGSGAAAGSGSNYSGSQTKTPSVGFTIHLRTPIAGETWTIATQNIISWDRAAGVSGQIEILNASTHALVGVIIPQLGPNQTSYTWDTRDILLSRTNPLKTTITPGTYLIRLAFDGNELAPVTSGAITIAQ